MISWQLGQAVLFLFLLVLLVGILIVACGHTITHPSLKNH